jgi:hypothetical protein
MIVLMINRKLPAFLAEVAFKTRESRLEIRYIYLKSDTKDVGM